MDAWRDVRWKGAGGFTLAEVMVALFILAVALLALGKVQTAAIYAGDQSGRRSVGLALAQDKIEEFQAGPLANVTDAAASETITVTGAAGGATRFTRTWDVLGDDDASPWGANTRQVSVTVTWTGGQVNLRTILSQ